jgi:catechol 2,3-dioxygenase-like lactoylglutathione lyase family enzyme
VLASSEVVSFVPITDAARARSFYEGVLGLTVVEEGPFAVVLDVNGAIVRLTPVQQPFSPGGYTVLGWRVTDIAAEVEHLASRGVTFEHYGMPNQDERGIWRPPDGGYVAWFHDPDGNTLSLTQFDG